jgi:hypothetical protein
MIVYTRARACVCQHLRVIKERVCVPVCLHVPFRRHVRLKMCVYWHVSLHVCACVCFCMREHT